MGNRIAASLIQRLRSSKMDTLMVSKTSAFPPVFTKDVYGIALASVTFDGFKRSSNNTAKVPCDVIKSTNIVGVSATNKIGEYYIQLSPDLFTDQDKYAVVGSIVVNNTTQNFVSAANTFFVKGANSDVGVSEPNKTSFFIQTLYSPVTNTTALCAGAAFAKTVNLLVFKM